MLKKFFLILIILSGIIAIGCVKKKNTQKAVADKKLNVVATTGMIADIVKNIGQDKIDVTALMGPGVDPHLYKASEGDVSRLGKSDIIFYNGLHLEGKMTELFEKLQNRKTTVAVAEVIEESRLLSPPEFEGAHDPHVWFDVNLWIKCVEIVSSTLQEKDSVNKSLYESNTQKYIAALNELHIYVKEKSESIDKKQRVLITAHDAFNYFGNAYGYEVRGLQGISTSSEAGTGDIKKLAEFIVERKIPAVFVETSVPERYIEALQKAVEARGFNVTIGGSLYSDAMGDAGTPEGTYIGMVRSNIDTIFKALKQ